MPRRVTCALTLLVAAFGSLPAPAGARPAPPGAQAVPAVGAVMAGSGRMARPSPARAVTSARRRPLCRRGYFPVRRGRGSRCVRPRLPRVRSTADLARALAALDRRPSRWPRLDAKRRAALAAARRVVLARLPHALDRARRLGTASSAARTAAAGDQGASFDSGWQRDGANLVREHGTVTTRSGAQSGRTEVVTQEFKIPNGSSLRYYSEEVRTSVVLRDCPNAKGQVTGSASIQRRARTEFPEDEVDSYSQSIKAAVIAPVNGDARVQPYDLKGTIRLDYVRQDWFHPAKPIAQDHRRIGFLDLRVPLGSVGARTWQGGPFGSGRDAADADLLMRRLYDEAGPRLKRIEAGWRERKQCVRVVASPSALSGLTAGARRSVIAHAQAVADGRDVTARIDARASGGTVTPARTTTRLRHPARLTFTMGRANSATITITATSNRGVGQRVVRVSGPATKLLTGTLTRTYENPGQQELQRTVYHVRFSLLGISADGVANYLPQAGSTWEASTSGHVSDCSLSGSGTGPVPVTGASHLYRNLTKAPVGVWWGGVDAGSATYPVHWVCSDPEGNSTDYYGPLAWAALPELGLTGLSGSRAFAGPNGVTTTYAWSLEEG